MANQLILAELRLFIDGVSAPHPHILPATTHLVQTGLKLLHKLPASRDAVFEYFALFFDSTVAANCIFNEVCIRSSSEYLY